MPAELDIHCICDHYATQSHPKIKAWLVTRARWRMQLMANQVERFFGLITEKGVTGKKARYWC